MVYDKGDKTTFLDRKIRVDLSLTVWLSHSARQLQA